MERDKKILKKFYFWFCPPAHLIEAEGREMGERRLSEICLLMSSFEGIIWVKFSHGSSFAVALLRRMDCTDLFLTGIVGLGVINHGFRGLARP